MKIFDITIPLSSQTPVWAGEESVSITEIERIANGDEYNVSGFSMGAHAGTHIDAPYHVDGHGKTVDQIPVEQFIGKAQIIQIADEIESITSQVLQSCQIEEDIHALIFKTGNSKFWKQKPVQFRDDFTALDSSAAEWIAEREIKVVGIDWFSISTMDDLFEPHKILLESGIVIIENLDLSEIQAGIYMLFCLPLKLVGTDGAPARAILVQED